MTEPRNPIKEKLTQPYLTYGQGVMDCWNYLYYGIGMKHLADQMLDYVSNQQENALMGGKNE